MQTSVWIEHRQPSPVVLSQLHLIISGVRGAAVTSWRQWCRGTEAAVHLFNTWVSCWSKPEKAWQYFLVVVEVRLRWGRWHGCWRRSYIAGVVFLFWLFLVLCRTGIHAYRDWWLSSKLKLLISVLSVSVVGGSVVLHKTNSNKSNNTIIYIFLLKEIYRYFKIKKI